MGEIVEFPKRRGACSRWQRGQAAISLTARPACAALAMALASSAPSLKARTVEQTLPRTVMATMPASHTSR